jgi:flagellar biosynthesis/type III secretory pathway protein FliH
MDTNNKHESDAAEELHDAAEALKSQADHRDEVRLEAERDQLEDLNQGMQTGTHDAFHSGIKWGSSYSIKDTTNPKKPSNVEKNDPDGNP